MPLYWNTEAPPREELDRALHYDPDTGSFTHKAHINRTGDVWATHAGKRAGTQPTPDSYVRIRHQGRQYKAHRLAWLISYGCLPACDIDHKNGVKNDNRLSNLRLADRYQSCSNRKTNKGNRYPKGIDYVSNGSDRPRWRARLWHHNRCHHIGVFDTVEEAIAARAKLALELRGPEWGIDYEARARAAGSSED